MRRAVLALASVLVLALALWWTEKGSAPAPAAAPPERVGGDGPADRTARLSAKDPPADARTPAEVAGPAAEPVETPSMKRATLSFLVTDAADLPIAGARVTGVEWTRAAEVRTDAEGRAELEVEHEGYRALLLVRAPGFAPQQPSVDPSESLQVRVRMKPGTSLHGRVLDAGTGRPVVGASVSWRRSRDVAVLGSCVTDDSGAYFLAEAPMGEECSYTIEAPGYADAFFGFQLDRESEHDFLLERGIVVRGRVVDLETRAPIENARVAGVATDGTGDFEVHLVPAGSGRSLRFGVFVPRPPGDPSAGVPYCPVEIRSLADGPSEPLLVPLARCVSLEGRVVDRQGKPVPRAWIEARDREQRLPRDDYPGGWRLEDCEGTSRSDEAGRFTLRGLAPWTDHEIGVESKGYFASELEIRAGLPGETLTAEVVLEQLPQGGTIVGRVTLNGERLPGTVYWEGVQGFGSTEADENGAYRAEVVGPGQVRLEVHPKGMALPREVCEAIVEVEPGGETRHDFELSLPMSTISGRIATASGRPLPEIEIDASGVYEGTVVSVFEGRSDEEGAYSIDVADVGQAYEVRFDYGDTQPFRFPVAAGARDVDFVLPDLGTLRYRVIDTAERPLSEDDCSVYWRPAGEALFRDALAFSDEPDPDGWCEARVPSGSFDLLVRADELGYRAALVAGRLLPADGRLDVEVRMEPGLSLELTLADGSDFLPEGHEVFLVEEEVWDQLEAKIEDGEVFLLPCELYPEGNASLQSRALSTLGPSSDVRLTGLAPGRYRFKVFPDDLEITPERIELTETPDEPVEIRWKWR